MGVENMRKAGLVVLLAGILFLSASCGDKTDFEPETTSVPEELWSIASTTGSTTTDETTTASTTSTLELTATTLTTDKKSNDYPYNYPGIAPVVATVPADPYLICVNRDYVLPANYSPVLQVCVSTYPEKIQMESTAATQYKAMYTAALADGAELIPYSGYRSIARQKNNFDNKIASYINKGYSRAEAVNFAAQSIQPPGCSEHNSGLAMDITRPGVWDVREDFDTTKEYTWLQAHAHEYGFILRYPKDKRSITQVMYEPWHWRYVGVGPATAMKASGQCLEEYLGIAS